MNRYYGTFKSQSQYRDYFVSIDARTYREAQDMMNNEYPDDWSMVYEEDNFKKDYYPKGLLNTL